MRLLKRSAYLLLAFISRVLAWMSGSPWGDTLCAKVADRYGVNCWFCRAVQAVLRDPEHCSSELRYWLLHKHRRDK